ncbi:uncharacterized protein Ecym_6237 [Eremothecium cymbalariae DBVPG|uniref:Uncharacterized protein n=1 Tax=Eremothecium cymbalariae (strain CBS 270.75 / DBVPG 7215 / KCTC 17166 / NRRL Y-17582) TaxID=931890 RepID=G8JVE0_ERECY|nr:hypothetical protein Ecym_6237 [Eremothecium cymbalariae DBVPG\
MITCNGPKATNGCLFYLQFKITHIKIEKISKTERNVLDVRFIHDPVFVEKTILVQHLNYHVIPFEVHAMCHVIMFWFLQSRLAFFLFRKLSRIMLRLYCFFELLLHFVTRI